MGLHSHMVITSRSRVVVTRSAKCSLSCPKQHSFTSSPPLSHIAWSLVSSSFNPMFSRKTGTQLVLNTYLLSITQGIKCSYHPHMTAKSYYYYFRYPFPANPITMVFMSSFRSLTSKGSPSLHVVPLIYSSPSLL